MTRKLFEQAVSRAIASIPPAFLDKVENLSFVVEDWPSPEVLAEAEAESPYDLLGYYQGWPLPERGHDYGGGPPDTITFYQRPIERHVRQSGQSLMRVLRETVMHELAHYFGFSEEEMEAVEDLWAGESESQQDE